MLLTIELTQKIIKSTLPSYMITLAPLTHYWHDTCIHTITRTDTRRGLARTCVPKIKIFILGSEKFPIICLEVFHHQEFFGEFPKSSSDKSMIHTVHEPKMVKKFWK